MTKELRDVATDLLELAQVDAEVEGVPAEEFANACFVYAAALTETIGGPAAVVRIAARIVDAAAGRANG